MNHWYKTINVLLMHRFFGRRIPVEFTILCEWNKLYSRLLTQIWKKIICKNIFWFILHFWTIWKNNDFFYLQNFFFKLIVIILADYWVQLNKAFVPSGMLKCDPLSRRKTSTICWAKISDSFCSFWHIWRRNWSIKRYFFVSFLCSRQNLLSETFVLSLTHSSLVNVMFL